MRLAVRLARETKSGNNELKKIIKSEPLYSRLNLTNGFVVNQTYLETKDCDWEMVIKNPRTKRQY